MKTETNNSKAILLVVPLGFAIYSYSKGYNIGKGALVTVLGTLAVAVVLGVTTIVYGTYQIANKDYTK
jgi:hypothetical protein